MDSQCTLLQDAAKRYRKLILEKYKVIGDYLKLSSHEFHKKSWTNDENFLNYLDSATVILKGQCSQTEYPQYGVVESCKYNINVYFTL